MKILPRINESQQLQSATFTLSWLSYICTFQRSSKLFFHSSCSDTIRGREATARAYSPSGEANLQKGERDRKKVMHAPSLVEGAGQITRVAMTKCVFICHLRKSPAKNRNVRPKQYKDE